MSFNPLQLIQEEITHRKVSETEAREEKTGLPGTGPGGHRLWPGSLNRGKRSGYGWRVFLKS